MLLDQVMSAFLFVVALLLHSTVGSQLASIHASVRARIAHRWNYETVHRVMAQHRFNQIVVLEDRLGHANTLQAELCSAERVFRMKNTDMHDALQNPCMPRVHSIDLQCSWETPDAVTDTLYSCPLFVQERTLLLCGDALQSMSSLSIHQALTIPLRLPSGSTVVFATAGTKFCMRNPKHILRSMGYSSITQDQVGDANANFGYVSTTTGKGGARARWPFQYPAHNEFSPDGQRIPRHFLVCATA
jgi:hypothetical protein